MSLFTRYVKEREFSKIILSFFTLFFYVHPRLNTFFDGSSKQWTESTGFRRLLKSKSNVPIHRAYRFTELYTSQLLPKNQTILAIIIVFCLLCFSSPKIVEQHVLHFLPVIFRRYSVCYLKRECYCLRTSFLR